MTIALTTTLTAGKALQIRREKGDTQIPGVRVWVEKQLAAGSA